MGITCFIFVSNEEIEEILNDITAYEFDEKKITLYKYIYIILFVACALFYGCCQVIAYRAYKYMKEQSELNLPISYTKTVENCNFEV